jgi:hypothetical protein
MRLYNKVQILKVLNQHLIAYPTPANLNWSWNWGSLAGLLLSSQILTGILLAMHYVGHVDYAFSSVQHLMTDVPSGMILRYAHANGASLFFTVVYLHILRGIYYSSGNQPREMVWITGVVILLAMIITAFIGYSLFSRKWVLTDLSQEKKLAGNLLVFSLINKKLLAFCFEVKTLGAWLLSGNFVGPLRPMGVVAPSDLILFSAILLNTKNGTKKPATPVKSYYNLHLTETQLKISKENKQKSGVYLVYNEVNGNGYIGSAITNRISVRFRNNCVHLTGGNKPLTRALNKYGLQNFSFHILEYYGGFVAKNDLKKSHLKLLELETSYIRSCNPVYNLLDIAGSSLGLKHSPETPKIKN